MQDVPARYKRRSLDQGSKKALQWKKPRAFWQTGKTSRWQTGNQEEGNEEMWERSRSWKRDWRLGLVFFCRGAGRRGDGIQRKARSVPIGARQAVPAFQWRWRRAGRPTVERMPRRSQGIHEGWCVFSPQDSSVDEWTGNFITLHHTEVDLKNCEKSRRRGCKYPP